MHEFAIGGRLLRSAHYVHVYSTAIFRAATQMGGDMLRTYTMPQCIGSTASVTECSDALIVAGQDCIVCSTVSLGIPM